MPADVVLLTMGIHFGLQLPAPLIRTTYDQTLARAAPASRRLIVGYHAGVTPAEWVTPAALAERW